MSSSDRQSDRQTSDPQVSDARSPAARSSGAPPAAHSPDAQPLTGPLPPSDAALIDAARRGDVVAYDELFHRHEAVIRRLARCLGRRDIEDLVMSVYAGAFDALRAGEGPTSAFRTYLLGEVLAYGPPNLLEVQELHERYDRADQPYRLAITPEQAAYGVDPSVIDGGVLDMYDDLPEDWQLVLWHSEVEHETPEQIALLMGVPPEDAWESMQRARSVFRQFTAAQHLATDRPARCRFVIDRLGALHSGALLEREALRVHDHLERCTRCATLSCQLIAIDERLRQILARAVLGDYCDTYLDPSLLAPPRLGLGARLRGFARRHRGVAVVTGAAAVGVVTASWGVLTYLQNPSSSTLAAWGTIPSITAATDSGQPVVAGEQAEPALVEPIGTEETVADDPATPANRARSRQSFLPRVLATEQVTRPSPMLPTPWDPVDTPDPVTSGPSTPPSTPGDPSPTSGPTPSGSPTPAPSPTPSHPTPQPSTPAPTTPVPSTPAPSTPAPSTPAPSTPASTPDTGTTEPGTPAVATRH